MLNLPKLRGKGPIAIDTETRDEELLLCGPGWGRGKGYVVGIAVAAGGESWYLPIRHKGGGNLDADHVLAWAREEFSGPEPKVFANAQYDLGWLKHENVPVAGDIWDVQLAEPLLDEYAKSYSLDTLLKKYGLGTKVEDELYAKLHATFGGQKGRRQAGNIWKAPSDWVEPYALGDVNRLEQLFLIQKEELVKQELWDLYQLEAKLCRVLVDMRFRGVRVDVKKAEEVDARWSEEILVYEKELPSGIDIYSAQSLATYCDSLGLNYGKTDKGNPSFEGPWLKNNLPLVYELRRLYKARDTFVRGYILDKHVNGRLHGTYNQLRSDDYGTVSGRLSSSNPNLTNVPSRDEEIGPLIRSMFLPDEGEELAAMDWSQIEFRLLVHFAVGRGAELARSMYNEDPSTDFHNMAAEITGVPRKQAKSVSFGLIYGMGINKLASELCLPVEQVRGIFSLYHEKLPFAKETANLAAKRAGARGYVRTLLGRRARFNDWEPDVYGMKEQAVGSRQEAVALWGPRVRRAYTHKALNRVLQGSAADILKLCLVKFVEDGVTGVLGMPLMNVHDEVVWSVPKTKEGQEAALEAGRIMCNCVDLKIPLKIDDERGPSWGEVK